MFIGKKYIYLNNWNYCAGLNDMKDRFTEYIKIKYNLKFNTNITKNIFD